MESLITTMRQCELEGSTFHQINRLGARAGFTLVELLIALSLSLMLLAGIFSASLFFTKSGLALADYAEMDRRGRVLMQTFSQDAKAASDLNFDDAQTLEFTVDGIVITYAFDSGELTRTKAGEPEQVLSEDIDRLQFRPYDIHGDPLDLSGDLLAVSTATKMVQLYFAFEWDRQSGFQTASVVESARYMLRNRQLDSTL